MSEETDKLEICLDRATARRQKIVNSARKLFLINGFHATGVAQISKESGVAVGQIYRDYACKEEIISVIVSTDCAEFLRFEVLDKSIAAGHLEGIWEWISDFLQPAYDDSETLLGEIVAEAGRNERVAAIFKAMYVQVFEAFIRALEALVPGEHLAARKRQLAQLIMATSLGLIQQRLTQPRAEIASTASLVLGMVRAEVEAMRRVNGG